MKIQIHIVTRVFQLAVLALMIFAYSGQNIAMAVQNDRVNELRKGRGRLVSEGQNKVPVGPKKILTYKLEELDLPQPQQIVSGGQRRQVTTVLRLTIKGELPQGRSAIWIDDVLFASTFGVGPVSVATLIYDPSLLRDGATISVGSGGELYDLPEPLRLPANLRTPPLEVVEEGNRITAMRTIIKIDGNRRERFVSIEMMTAQPLPVRDGSYLLQIGRKFFPNLVGGDRQWKVEVTAKEFQELKDGARVSINNGPFTLIYLGRFNRTMIDR